ncbi:MAG: bifunctional folylpolyglutamate synthase/dihydrofolate synthase [Fuerstiella sp.]|nr:bifunctional folylpolyglutamate synthase/dihydrofolate synthase [Fuerstiella sp.]MCP4506036.1 bifunctional folylpolyglutamate synthase/dihydrofolate synthase [Fuerstiella sp.]
MENTLSTTYEDAVRWIYDRIDYERVRPRRQSGHFRLERVERLLALIGSPQQRIRSIHIAGTKGKGSTAAMVDAMLTASGIRSGLFTSPHIHLFEERMRVAGRMPAPDELTSMVRCLQDILQDADADLIKDGVTYFEVATLLTWMYFDRNDVSLAVLETGLGGRLDCTTICRPVATVITSIGLDHTHILGHTIEAIAGEKAGIIKLGVPVFSWVQQPEAVRVVTERSAALECELFLGDCDIFERVQQMVATDVGKQQCSDDSGRPCQRFDVTTPLANYTDLMLPLLGEHQRRNAALAVAVLDLLSQQDQRVTADSMAEGLASLSWPLRFEVVSTAPLIVLDAAHNPDSIEACLHTLNSQAWPAECRTLIFAVSRDKDADQMLQLVRPHFKTIILTRFETNPRSYSPQELADLLAAGQSPETADTVTVVTAETPAEALSLARKTTGHDGPICGTGSIFLAAELRNLLRQSDGTN